MELFKTILDGVVVTVNGDDEQPMDYDSVDNYASVIDTIMASCLAGSTKVELIGIIRRKEQPEYFHAIKTILNSSMCSSHKIEAISKLQ